MEGGLCIYILTFSSATSIRSTCLSTQYGKFLFLLTNLRSLVVSLFPYLWATLQRERCSFSEFDNIHFSKYVPTIRRNTFHPCLVRKKVFVKKEAAGPSEKKPDTYTPNCMMWYSTK